MAGVFPRYSATSTIAARMARLRAVLVSFSGSAPGASSAASAAAAITVACPGRKSFAVTWSREAPPRRGVTARKVLGCAAAEEALGKVVVDARSAHRSPPRAVLPGEQPVVAAAPTAK